MYRCTQNKKTFGIPKLHFHVFFIQQHNTSIPNTVVFFNLFGNKENFCWTKLANQQTLTLGNWIIHWRLLQLTWIQLSHKAPTHWLWGCFCVGAVKKKEERKGKKTLEKQGRAREATLTSKVRKQTDSEGAGSGFLLQEISKCSMSSDGGARERSWHCQPA